MPNYTRACIIGAIASVVLACVSVALFWAIIASMTSEAFSLTVAVVGIMAIGGGVAELVTWSILRMRVFPTDRARHAKAGSSDIPESLAKPFEVFAESVSSAFEGGERDGGTDGDAKA